MSKAYLLPILLAGFAAPATLFAQDRPKPPPAEDAKAEDRPTLEEWLAQGNTISVELPFERPCAIPLREVPAKADGAVRQLPPQAKSNTPVVEPPTCESSEGPVIRFIPKEDKAQGKKKQAEPK